jgi:hypothetical protein
MTTTANMGLSLPSPGVDEGPGWAEQLNDSLSLVDLHNHTAGKGTKIPVAGLDLQADLTINSNSHTDVKSVKFTSQSSSLTTTNAVYVVNGELYFSDSGGTNVQITSGGSLNLASTGTIGGDYAQVGVNATVTYSDTTKTYSFLQAAGSTAKMYSAKISLADSAGGSNAVGIIPPVGLASGYDLTLPTAAPGADQVLAFASGGQASFRDINGTTGQVSVAKTGSAFTISLPTTITQDLTLSGNNSGRGILPVGAIIAMNTNLTGVTAVTATTAADANGFVVCGSVTQPQIIVDPTSPLNGQTIPNLNDSYFLMGASSSGSTGGANSTTLTTTQLPAHTHTIDHGHSDSYALSNNTVAGSGHTHTIAHVHQVAYGYSTGSGYSLISKTARTGSSLSFNNGSTSIGTMVTDVTSTGEDITGGNTFSRVTATTATYYSSGATDDSGNASNSGTPSATSTVTLSGSVTSHLGSSGSSGTGSSYDSRPKFFAVRFIMRIK